MTMTFCPQCGNDLVVAESNGAPRLVCAAPGCAYVFWDNPAPVVAAVVEFDDAIILVRNKSWPEKYYGLVTGYLEKGETPEAGVLREVKEELGLEGTIAGFIGYYSFLEMNQLILAFHVLAQGTLTLGEELADMISVAPDKLRPWDFGTGLAVRDWLQSRKTMEINKNSGE